MLFGKKNKNEIRVMHYEGIPEFATDYPCTLEVTDTDLIIHRLKPDTIVKLPLSRIQSFSAMDEKSFLTKYHGTSETTSKSGIKYYLVALYDKGMLAFWGTAAEYKRFLDLQHSQSGSQIIKL